MTQKAPGSLLSAPYWAPFVALTDAATVALDASLGNSFRLVLTASGHAMGAPTNPTDGQTINIVVNSGAGSFTFTWNAVFDFGGGGAPTHSVAANKRDLVSAEYSSAEAVWIARFSKGS